MAVYGPDESTLAAYEKTREKAREAVALALAALSDGEAPLQHRRDYREALERVAGEILRFRRGFRFPGDDANDLTRADAERRQRALLDTVVRMLDESLVLARKRFPVAAAKAAASSPEPAALGRIASDTAPSQDVITGFEDLERLAREAEALASAAKADKARRLERDFLAVKLRAFLDAARDARTENPELLFKTAYKLEKACAGPALRGPVAELPDRTLVAWEDGGSLRARYVESGVTLALDATLAPGALAIEGRAENALGSAEFSLRPSAGSVDAETFLARTGLASVVAALRAAIPATAVEEAPDLSASLSRALDDML